MSDVLRILGQVAPAAATLTDLYTVSNELSVTVSSIVVCNRGGSATTFRIAFAVNGEADATKQYVYYDIPTPAFETFIATVGFTLGPLTVVRVYAGNGNLSFQLFGVEVTP